MSASAEDPLLHMASPDYSPPAAAPAAAPATNTTIPKNSSTRNRVALQPSPFDASSSFNGNGTPRSPLATVDGEGASVIVNVDTTIGSEIDDENEAEYPQLSLLGALFCLSLITITVAACSEFLTGAIEAVSASSGINQAFLGLIILPIAGNACEHITAVFVAVKNKMDLAISVALGSSIQIATFVLPVTVLAGWAMGKELTLDFDPFAVLMLFVSVILAYFVSSDGTSNWLLGLQLVVTYVLIGAVYFWEDESEGGGGGGGKPPTGLLNVTGT
jgi:Ca2+/Na+ antiporter